MWSMEVEAERVKSKGKASGFKGEVTVIWSDWGSAGCKESDTAESDGKPSASTESASVNPSKIRSLAVWYLASSSSSVVGDTQALGSEEVVKAETAGSSVVCRLRIFSFGLAVLVSTLLDLFDLFDDSLDLFFLFLFSNSETCTVPVNSTPASIHSWHLRTGASASKSSPPASSNKISSKSTPR